MLVSAGRQSQRREVGTVLEVLHSSAVEGVEILAEEGRGNLVEAEADLQGDHTGQGLHTVLEAGEGHSSAVEAAGCNPAEGDIAGSALVGDHLDSLAAVGDSFAAADNRLEEDTVDSALELAVDNNHVVVVGSPGEGELEAISTRSP
jgi:hypothetical protein